MYCSWYLYAMIPLLYHKYNWPTDATASATLSSSEMMSGFPATGWCERLPSSLQRMTVCWTFWFANRFVYEQDFLGMNFAHHFWSHFPDQFKNRSPMSCSTDSMVDEKVAKMMCDFKHVLMSRRGDKHLTQKKYLMDPAEIYHIDDGYHRSPMVRTPTFTADCHRVRKNHRLRRQRRIKHLKKRYLLQNGNHFRSGCFE